MKERVADLYEALPYPTVDPEADTLGPIDVTPSHLLEINQYVFGGRLDFTRPFRALSAGGGTGNAALMLAAQLAACGTPGEVVHLDVSSTTQAIARRRAERRGLTNLRFVHASLFDAASLGLGLFDYIDCSGMLHHLESPAGGLAALAAMLAPGGGIGLMVYGELGRTGLYHVQRALQLLDGGEDLDVRLATARRLVAALPANAWLRRNSVLGGDHAGMSDAELADRYLHPQDRAYLVPALRDLAGGGGFTMTTLVPPGRYDAAIYLSDDTMAAAARALPRAAQEEMAELLSGDMATHTAYLVRAGEPGHEPPVATAPDTIPVLRRGDPVALAAEIGPDTGLVCPHGGIVLEFPLPTLTAPIIALMDGQRRLIDIYDALKDDSPDLLWMVFLDTFSHLYEAMHRHLFRLFLSRQPIPTALLGMES